MHGETLKIFGWIFCAAAACIVTVASGEPVWLLVAVASLAHAGAHLALTRGGRPRREREEAERVQVIADALGAEPLEVLVLGSAHRASELRPVRHGGPQLIVALEFATAASEPLLRGTVALAKAELEHPGSAERSRARAASEAFATLVIAGLVTAVGPKHVAWLAGVSMLGLGLWAATAAADAWERLGRGSADRAAADVRAAVLAGGPPWVAEALLAIDRWEAGHWVRRPSLDQALIRLIRPLEPEVDGRARARELLGLPSDSSPERILEEELREVDPIEQGAPPRDGAVRLSPPAAPGRDAAAA